MTSDELRAIRKRCEAATPGPWRVHRHDNYGGDISDFDLPSYYDKNLGYYRSPNGQISTDANTIASYGKYKQWAEKFKEKLDERRSGSIGVDEWLSATF